MLLNLVQRAFPNDSGPIYKETVEGRIPVEPFNTASNLIFLFIVIYFGFKVYRDPKKHWFLAIALPIIGIGYIGGTLYHGLRSAEIWLLLDWVPIMGLTLASILYFIFKWKESWTVRVLLVGIIIGAFFGIRNLPIPEGLRNTIGYIVSAITILIPLFGYLYKTRWQHLRSVLAAFGIFSLAVFFRFLDQRLDLEIFWMGTHWLWHLLGGTAVFFLILYIYEDNKGQAGRIS